MRTLNRHLTEGDGNSRGMEREWRDRAAAMESLIASNPAEALSVALPAEQLDHLRRQFPERVSLLETSGEWQGRAAVQVFDDFQNHVSQTRWRMKLDGASVELHFAGTPPPLACERELKVSGIRLAGLIAVSRVTASAAASAACTTTGVQQTAVLLLSFPNTPFPLPSAFLQDVFFGPHSVNGFYSEQSFGQVSITGSVLGPFTLDAGYACGDTGNILLAAIRAADAAVDFTQYQRIVLVTPDTGCGLTGFSNIGCSLQSSPSRGQFTAGVSWLTANGAATSQQLLPIAAHEFGHSLGEQHAHSLDFKTEALGPSGGLLDTYGDLFSIMGTNGPMGHFNAPEKADLGWLAAQNVQQVQSGGTFLLKPIESASTGLQAIRVQRAPNSTQWLWVEFRQPGSNYETFFQPNLYLYNGALIHLEEGSAAANGTELLDFNPVQAPNNFVHAALLAGSSWKDRYGPLALTVNSAGPTGLSITVTYGDTIFAAPNSLNFTVAPTSQPQSQTVSLAISSPGYSFTVSTGASTWLTASPASGALPASLNVTVNASALTPGNYTGSVIITAPGAINSPLTVPVTLSVPAGSTAGLWTFDTADITGNLAIDRSGNALLGSIFNAFPVPGRVNQALAFNGPGSFVAAPDSAGLRLTHDLTLTTWIQTRNNSQTQDFLSKYDFSGAESGYLLQVLPTGVLNLHVGGNNLAAGSRDAADTTVINDGAWHHLAVSIGIGQDVKFYLDGRLSSTQPQVTAASQNVTPLYIGTFPGAYYGQPFTGSLDEVKLYARRLSSDEIQALAGTAFPVISSFSPASYPQGTSFTLTVNGSGFIPGSVVFEPDAALHPGLAVFPTTYVSATQLTVVVPRDFTMFPSTVRLQVYNGYPNGAASSVSNYTITPLVPAIAGLSPSPVTAGGPAFDLTVTGTNFIAPCSCFIDIEPGSSIVWNGTQLLTTWYSPTRLTATIPAGLIGSPGSATITINSPGSVSAPVSLTIGNSGPPLVMSCTPNTGPSQLGTPFSVTCTASGGMPTYNWAISSGALPAGISLSAAVGSSVTIAGTPTALAAYNYTVRATDSTTPTAQTASQTYFGTVMAPLAFTCTPATGPVQAGVAYSTTCTVSAGIAPFSWSIGAGALPAGLSLNLTEPDGHSVTIGGVPSAGGTYVYTLTALDGVPNRQSLTFSGTIAGAAPPPSTAAPAAYWTFDSADISGIHALDRSGNGLTGVISNAAPAAGKVGQALSFSGAGSYVAIPDSAGLSLAHNLTLAAWVKTTNSTQTQDFVSKYDFSGSESGYMLQMLSSGVVNLHVGGNNQGTASRDTSDTTIVNDGQWHHVAVVITIGQKVMFYIDGQLSTTRQQVVLADRNLAPLYLGTFPGAYNGLPFTGSLDEIRIYSQALTATDIAALSGSVAPLPPPPPPPATTVTPSAYWTFDIADLAGNQVLDRSGNGLTGTLSNALPVAGRVGQAVSFSGAGSYVTVADNPAVQLTQDLTLSAWVKTTNNSQVQDFVSKYDFSGSETGYILQILPTGALNLHVGGNNLASGSRDAADARAINDGQWHHVAVVIATGQNVRFYIDGQLSSTQPQVTAPSRNSVPLFMGTFPGAYNGLPFTGMLDEVRIYNRALAVSDIQSLASGN